MLYEFRGKIYIKPFSNKLVEVNIVRNPDDYDIELTNKKIEITPQIEKEIAGISLENAYNRFKKNKKKVLNTI